MIIKRPTDQGEPARGPARNLAAALLLTLAVSGCSSSGKPALSVKQEVRPALASIDDLDAAALARLAKATEASGGDAADPALLYRRLAAREPSAPAPRVALGRLLLKRNDIDGAETAFREALALAPKDVDAQVGAAQILLARKRAGEALAAFEAALASEPDNVRALNGQGLALDQLGRRGEAQASYRRALAIEPRNGAVRNNLGLSLALAGQRKEALAILEPLAREPDALPRYRATLAHARGVGSTYAAETSGIE